jgi:hypothetical protein
MFPRQRLFSQQLTHWWPRLLTFCGGGLIVLGLSVDRLGLGTAGGHFGPTQLAVILLGASLLAWRFVLACPLHIRPLLFVILSLIVFSIWGVWPYQLTLHRLHTFTTLSFSDKILFGCYLTLLGIAIGSLICGLITGYKTVRKTVLLNGGLLLISLMFTGLCAEIGFRRLLFSTQPWFARLRDPGLYGDEWTGDDDFWKLYYRFGGALPPPAHPHPLLGWIGNFSPTTYRHQDDVRLAGRRPVLLYGDSFAACTAGVECFQDILNADAQFAAHHYLLNYGVSGYDVGQIYLLLQQTAEVYPMPFIVVSLMTLDLDRSILSVRIGQKPYFTVANGNLTLQGVPIDPDPAHFFATHPPQIRSYLYRKMLYGTFFPKPLTELLRNNAARLNNKQTVNAALLRAIIAELRRRQLDFVFLIFHPHNPVSPLDQELDWRDPFLKQLFREQQVPYIWSKTLFQQDVRTRGGQFTFDDYIVPDNGHPTSYFNRLIAAELKHTILAAPTAQP